MTGVSERLDAIEARAANCRTYNFGMRAADKLAHEDVWALLDLARKQQAAIDALNDWCGRNKTGFYDEAQDDAVQIIRNAMKEGK